MFERGKKAQYTCEILEGPEGKPLYRVTSSEDPNNPIVRDSSTGCWVYICSKVNDLAEVKKQKVTISGTERFGLLEANVCRILENLPNAEKCTKYKFKYRVVNQEDDEDII
jgi:F/Y rich C-terminus.